MLFKNIAGKNYFVVLFVLVGIIAFLIVGGFVLTALVPEALGRSPLKHSIDSVYEFEPWTFEIDNLETTFSGGGIIAFANETKHNRSILLLGDAEIRHHENLFDADSYGGVFLLIDDAVFEQIRGGNIFRAIEEQATLEQVEDVFAEQIGLPVIWDRKVPITFHTSEDNFFYYLLTEEGKPLLPPPGDNYNLSSTLASHLAYLIFVAIMLVIITVFTLDNRSSRYFCELHTIEPGRFSIFIILPLAGIALFSEIYAGLNNNPDYYVSIVYLAMIIALIFVWRAYLIDYLNFGLSRSGIGHGYLLAILAAALILGVTRGAPSGLTPDLFSSLARFPLIFLLVALPREMIWRGYIQVMLSRKMGAIQGLIATAALVAVSHFIFIAATEPWMIFYPYTYLEITVLAPGTAAILGFLYFRTENILACALLHSLIVFLPGVILY